MMYKYFKIYAVLLAALGCGRARCDVYFFCTQCSRGVNWKDWGRHAEQNHPNAYKKPFFLWCPSHGRRLAPVLPLEVCGKNVGCFDEHVRCMHGEKYITYDLWCTKCNMVVPRHLWEMHLIRVHPDVGGLYRVFCSACKKEKFFKKKEDQSFCKSEKSDPSGCSRNFGLFDSSSIIIQSYTVSSGMQSENSDAFESEGDNFEWVGCSCMQFDGDRLFCQECKRDDILCHLGLEHLFAEHKDKVKQYLPQYEFYCKECKKTFKTAQEWGSHVFKCEGRLKQEGKWGVFYCPLCKKCPETFYEEHVTKAHPNECIYCFEKLQNEESRGEHMKAHKIFCPFCEKNEFEVPLAVHIMRAHEIWEGPCPWDRRREVRCKLCSQVIKYNGTDFLVFGGSDKDMKGFYADIAINNLKAIPWHFYQEHEEEYKVFKNQFDKFGKEIPDELFKSILQGGSIKVSSVMPCKGLHFRYSGLCVLEGHGHHGLGGYMTCVYCESLLIPKDDDNKWYTKWEVSEEHWKLFHPGMKYCKACKFISSEKDCDKHLLSKHSNEHVKCPLCFKVVLMKNGWYHGVKEHDKEFVFCTECKQWGAGSCPGCGEWVLDVCKKCPQRIYGTCPQCEKTAFKSCSECQQYVTGQCSRCEKEANGKCLKCVVKVSGKCPVCGKYATDSCVQCKQRVVGKCSVCGKCASGVCSDCKQKVGSISRIYKAFESHMREKHGKKLQDKQVPKVLCRQADMLKGEEGCRWCEACGVYVLNKDEDRIAHCRDRHKGSCNGWCELCRWDFDGTLDDHLKKKHCEEVESCNGCGLRVSNLDKRHLARHTCFCIQCEKTVPFEHMKEAHGCTSECKPIADSKNHIWEIKHDEQCPIRSWFKCNFPDCKFEGSGDDAFRKHIMDAHGCTKDCEYKRNGYRFKITHCGCMNDETSPVSCPFDKCTFVGTKANFLKHVYGPEHGCIEGKCVYGKDGFRHDADCEHKIFTCPFDGCTVSGVKKNMEEHMYDAHKCIRGYCTFKEGIPSHAVICPNRVFKCPVCHASSVTKQHLKDFHGCRAFCHINEEGNGIDHDLKCEHYAENHENFSQYCDRIHKAKK